MPQLNERHLVRCLVVAAIISAWCAVPSAAPTTAANALVLSQRFLNAAFPELVGRHLTARFSIECGFDAPGWIYPRMGVQVFSTARSGPTKTATESPDDQLLVGTIGITRGYIDDAAFDGRHVHSREMDALRKLGDQHREWTVRDIAVELSNLNARYGPDAREAFLRAVKLERFAPAFGRIRRVEARFEMQFKDAGGFVDQAPGWGVSFEAARSGQPHLCYRMNFEPIDGRLTWVVAEACEPPER